jgi:hypothetical protein
MPLISRSKSLAAGAALSLALVSGAAPARTPAASAQQIDRDLQALKDDTIALNRDLHAIEQALLYPDQSRTTLYISVKVGGFLIDEVSVRINENEPVTRSYTDSEARALLKDGWHRLQRLRLEPGTYRLQAEFKGHFYDARPEDPPVTGRIQTVFEKGLSELDLVLPVSRQSRLDRPGLAELSRLETRRRVSPARSVWLPQPERFESALGEGTVGTPNDPRYRSALFLRHDGRYLSALTELLDIADGAAGAARPEPLPGPFHLLLAECYLGFGMARRAEGLFRTLADGDFDPETLARARLQLGQFAYHRGYFDESLERLNAMRKELPEAVAADWRLLMTEVLLVTGRYNEAIAFLTTDGEAGDLPAVLRYNLAVALMRDGRTAEGRKQLNLVGTMDVRSHDDLALRDKANLTLGYRYLHLQQGENARTVFGRVRTSGPFSNRALLGLGWAEVAPVAQREAIDAEAEGRNTDDSLGTLLRPGYVDPKARERLKVKPGPGKVSEAEQEALMRALVPWAELVKRDPMDPAVQEGMLAIPWALDRLQAYEHSLAKYLEAIAALENARKRMDEAMKSIRGGRMVETIVRRDVDSERGWLWRMRDLPDAPETYFLQSLLAEHRFQEQIKNYRDARLLVRNLDSWQARLDELEGARASGTVATPRQLQRARQGWRPVWAGTVIWLGLDPALGPPGAYDAPLSAAPRPPADLVVLGPPARFEGLTEYLQPVRERIRALKPRIQDAATAQDNLLEFVSLKELEGQKATIERYLTEARFAVARIYDRQRQGGR